MEPSGNTYGDSLLQRSASPPGGALGATNNRRARHRHTGPSASDMYSSPTGSTSGATTVDVQPSPDRSRPPAAQQGPAAVASDQNFQTPQEKESRASRLAKRMGSKMESMGRSMGKSLKKAGKKAGTQLNTARKKAGEELKEAQKKAKKQIARRKRKIMEGENDGSGGSWSTSICACHKNVNATCQVVFCHPCNVSYQYSAVQRKKLHDEEKAKREAEKKAASDMSSNASSSGLLQVPDAEQETGTSPLLGDSASDLVLEETIGGSASGGGPSGSDSSEDDEEEIEYYDEDEDEMNPVPCLTVIVFNVMFMGLGSMVASLAIRYAVRNSLKIWADPVNEFCYGFFLFPCSMCQTHRELELRGVGVKKFRVSDVAEMPPVPQHLK